MNFIEAYVKNPNLKIIKGDLLDLENLKKAIKDHDIVFHLAANADISSGALNTKIDLEQNTITTYNVLEAMRVNNIKKIVFSSSATVYGDAEKIPTPEDYPTAPISYYGASKVASESLITAFCHMNDMQAWIFRFAKVIGDKYSHGVIFDFVKKLKNNPKKLLILGNGRQKMTMIHVNDIVDAVFFALEKAKSQLNLYNIGNTDWITVDEIANIVCKEMKLNNVEYVYTGEERGWKGDTPKVFLDISKIEKLGWKPKISVEDSIKKTIKYLFDNPDLLERKMCTE
jgi:UDP-glucose 4-epimerase